MKKILPALYAVFFVFLCDAGNVVRAPLEQSRPSYNYSNPPAADKMVDKQWREQQQSQDSMRRKSDAEMQQRIKKGQESPPPVKQ